MLKSITLIILLIFSFSAISTPTNHEGCCSNDLKIMMVDDFSDKDENRISWNANRRLTWDDFQADPEWWNNDIAAITSSVIQYKYSCENGKLNYSVKSIFLMDESWVKKKAKTAHYLAHEQLHFDVTEVFTRKLKEKLSKHTFRCDEVKKFESITKDILTDWQNTQKRYDYQTRYSLNKEKQDEWVAFIADILDAYDKYK